MKRVRGLRARIRRTRDYYPKRGIGAWIEYGSTGSTYGEPGKNMSFTATVLVAFWEIEVGLGWKALATAADVAEYERLVREQEAYNRRRDEEDALRERESEGSS